MHGSLGALVFKPELKLKYKLIEHKNVSLRVYMLW